MYIGTTFTERPNQTNPIQSIKLHAYIRVMTSEIHSKCFLRMLKRSTSISRRFVSFRVPVVCMLIQWIIILLFLRINNVGAITSSFVVAFHC